MNRPFAKTKFVAALSMLFVAATFAPQVFAQDKPNAPAAPQLYSVSVVRVISGMGDAFREFRKAERIPALRKGGVKQQGVWTTANFGGAGEYVIATPVESLSQYDSPGPVVKALGEEAARAHNTKMARMIADSHTFLITLRPDLSLAPKPGYEFKIAFRIRVSVTPGRAADYEKNIKEALAVIAKTNAKGVLVSQVGLGGNPNEYLGLILFDSFADLQQFIPSFGKALAEAKVAPPAPGVVAHTEFAVYRYLPELSIQPPVQRADAK